jgi:predicted metal-dependent HD superfamily phosphohydrolase
MTDNIYKKVAQHVTGLYEEYLHPNLVYHNLDHTKKVVERVQEIAGHYQLNETDMLTLYVAAWFHDVGHMFSEIATHEEKSVEMMREYMAKQNVDAGLIQSVEDCIRATRMPHEPKNMLQEIVCDGDTYHFGTDEFKKTNKQIRKEYKLRNYTPLLIDWEKNTLDLLERHQFFTTYCQVLLAEGKQKNIERARKKYVQEVNETSQAIDEEEGQDPKLVKQRMSMVTRGVQTMLRLTSENHIQLSGLADGKANILISVNAIIISVILSVLVRKLEVDPHLTIPTILFLVFSLSTIVISILATMPKVSEGRFSRADVMNKRINLLFFGNFYKSTLEEYEWGMGILMKDKDYLYGSLVKDIHHLGVVLARKYKLIRLAYTVFMIGIVVSVIAFTIATLFARPADATTVTMPPGTPL